MIKLRSVRRDRTVPHTVGGQTYDVTEQHESLQLVQPRDMDAVVARLLWVMTFLVVCAALVWSTTAVGHLLSLMAPVWVSYLVAVVFDLAWVTCMAAEWLMRYDRPRARVAYWAGWAFLAVSILAIATDGAAVTGKPVIGAAGGVVSAISKGLWMVVMSISAQRLSPLDQQWYEKASSAAAAELALVRARRKLAHVKALQAQEKAALDAILGHVPVTDAAPDDVPEPDRVSRVPQPVRSRPSRTAIPEGTGQDNPSRPVVQRDDLQPRRDLTDLVRDLRTDGLDEEQIKKRVREIVPDVKADSLRKSLRRTRTA